MTESSPWLPELIKLDSFGGSWPEYCDHLYSQFRADFDRPCSFRGKPLTRDQQRVDGKEAAFWHLISQDDDSGSRLPDLLRCERIHWARAIIEHADDIRVSAWSESRKGRRRWLLWLEHADYLVVLEERGRWMVLITAYVTNYAHTRRRLRRGRAEAEKSQAPPIKDGASTPPTHGR